MLVGAAVSLLVEATQLTGNWFLMPCSYRLADVNDLLTNTAGTAVGVGLASFLPAVFQDPRALRAQRHLPRPVTRARRWTAILLDLWIVGVAVLGALVLLSGVYALLLGGRAMGPAESRLLTDLLRLGAVFTAVLLGVVPSLVGGGSSLGQRIVHLRPVPVPGRRSGLRLLHPATLRGLAIVGICSLDLVWTLAGLAWLAADVLWVIRDPRGLSCVVTGHDLVDTRATAVNRALAGSVAGVDA